MATKKNAIDYLKMAKPFMRLGAEVLADLDDNDTGSDDVAAAAINYSCDVVDAVTRSKAIPPVPEELLKIPRSER